MKVYLLSDNIDSKVGMRLAGISGIELHDRESALEVLDKCVKNKEIGIILITEKLADLIKEELKYYKLKLKSPLIVEIPDRHGTKRDENSITKYIREAIGLKI